MKLLIFIHQGCCRAVFSSEPAEVEVIDLDGDYRDEGTERLHQLETHEETLGPRAELHQTWP